jgi:hypothetical protein
MVTPERVVSILWKQAYIGKVPRVSGPQVAPLDVERPAHMNGDVSGCTSTITSPLAISAKEISLASFGFIATDGSPKPLMLAGLEKLSPPSVERIAMLYVRIGAGAPAAVEPVAVFTWLIVLWVWLLRAGPIIRISPALVRSSVVKLGLYEAHELRIVVQSTEEFEPGYM